jgi:hypothetical protein
VLYDKKNYACTNKFQAARRDFLQMQSAKECAMFLYLCITFSTAFLTVVCLTQKPDILDPDDLEFGDLVLGKKPDILDTAGLDIGNLVLGNKADLRVREHEGPFSEWISDKAVWWFHYALRRNKVTVGDQSLELGEVEHI